MTNRGKILEEAIRESGQNLKTLADKVGVNRNTFYLWFKDPELPVDKMLQVAQVIGYGWCYQVPVLRDLVNSTTLENEDGQHLSKLDQLERKNTELLIKYSQTLEEINRLLKENQQLKDQINE